MGVIGVVSIYSGVGNTIGREVSIVKGGSAHTVETIKYNIETNMVDMV